MELSVLEAAALSRFLYLDSGRRDMETMKMYLLAIRYTLEIFQLLKMI